MMVWIRCSVGLGLLLLICVLEARAQTAHLDCDATATPTTARQEEETARLGDVLISCVTSDPGLPAPGEYVSVNLRLDAKYPLPLRFYTITNRTKRVDDSFTVFENVLIVNGNDCTLPSPVGGAFNCGGDYQDPQYGLKTSTGASGVTWENVRVPFPGETNSISGLPNPEVATIRITDVRAQIASSGLLDVTTSATVVLTAEPPEAIEVPSTPLVVAEMQKGLFLDVDPFTSRSACLESSSESGPIATMTLREGFATAFKPMGSPSFFPDDGSEVGYYSEGFDSPSFPGDLHATYIRLGFLYIPEGVTLKVPTTLDNGSGLVLTELSKACSTSGEETLTPIHFVFGGREVVYRVCQAGAGTIEQVDVPITAQWTAGLAAGGVVEVLPSFIPSYRGQNGVPRFWPPIDDPDLWIKHTAPVFSIAACGRLSSGLAVTRSLYGYNSSVYVAPGDSSGPFPLGPPGPVSPLYIGKNYGNEYYPAWSPDAKRIAVVSNVSGLAGIYVADASGSGLLDITPNSEDNRLGSWSPDASKFAFQSDRDVNYEIYTMNADGTEPTRMTFDPALDGDPRWSPDGTKIAFVSRRDGNEEIYTISPDGTGLLRLTFAPNFDGLPLWSPDSSRILFLSYRDGNSEIYVMNADGSEQTNLTNDAGADNWPDWSPDGSRIVFESNRNGRQQVYIMNADGSGLVNFTNTPEFSNGQPSWSPDGLQIAFVSSRRQNGGPDLFVQDIGSATARLVFSDVLTNPAVWQPLAEAPVRPGVYREGEWMLDVNGDGEYDVSDDKRFFLGFPGAKPFVGDWNGDGHDEVGVYAGGFWFLDLNGDAVYDEAPFAYGWDDPLVKPITGDWNGDGKTDVGLYVNGIWFLDSNGNQTYDGPDAIFGLGGWEGSVPFVGDWDGDGKDSAGIYSFGFWFLDNNGDGAFDTNTGDKLYPFGWNDPLVQPQVGDWSGDGKTNVGVYAAGTWFVDSDGDELFTGADKVMSLGWNNPALVPVVGDWNGDGRETPGVVDGGVWYLEKNGDWFFDGNDPIVYWGDDWPSGPQDLRRFLPGRW